MARAYRMTPARRAALKKAQAASARKRRGKGKGKLAAANRKNTISRKRKAIGYGMMAAGYGLMAYGTYKHHKSVQSDMRRINARANISVRESTTTPIIRGSRKIAKGGSRGYSSAVLRRGVDQRASTRALLRKQTRRKKRR